MVQLCFLRQFRSSIQKSDYLALRLGFVNVGILPFIDTFSCMLYFVVWFLCQRQQIYYHYRSYMVQCICSLHYNLIKFYKANIDDINKRATGCDSKISFSKGTCLVVLHENQI
jgi:hypothetical protein